MFGKPQISPELLMSLGGGIMSGQNLSQGLGQGFQNASNIMAVQKQEREIKEGENKTRAFVQKMFPTEDVANMPPEMLKMYANQAIQQRFAKPTNDFKVLPDGTYGVWDGSNFNTLGTATKPADPTAIQRDLQAAGLQPGTPEYQRAILDNYRKNGGQDDYANRAAMAAQLGMGPDDPRYQSFVLTGKMPREDAQALTAVDKKAILEADEMVAVNEGAINALKQAKAVSTQANAGWFSGTRATIGSNLPDWMVPDAVSSPESSAATQDFDNAVIGQALTQLKAIFGGAPTEGERKILLDLQGSSNLQPEVREKILDRAIQMAERRLEFNRQRAEEMRGGTYYKPNSTTASQPTTTGGKTSNGLNFTVEP
jgi:hypothetical protein